MTMKLKFKSPDTSVPRKRAKHKPRHKGTPPRRPGRPSVLDGALSMTDILKVFEKGLSAVQSAKLLGISPRTYRDILIKKGYYQPYKPLPSGPDVEYSNGYKVPFLIMWCREHPSRKLPRSISKIAEITGLPKENIKQYFKRRKRHLRQWLEALGPLTGVKDKVFVDSVGRSIPTNLISIYTLTVETFELDVVLDLMLKGGVRLKTKLPWKEYIKVFDKTPADAPWVAKKRSIAKTSGPGIKSPSSPEPQAPSSETHPDYAPSPPDPCPR